MGFAKAFAATLEFVDRINIFIRKMPTICTFFGIVIRMYFNDHAPPHFHVIYQDNEAKIDIETLEVVSGHLSRRALGLALDWAELHQGELLDNWTLALQRMPLKPIKPLE